MRKIKISELPLYSSLKGLFTIGTDNQNRSVKVSLKFVEETTNEAAEYAKTHTDTAVANAETATAAANTSAALANQKATVAQTAADACNTATSKANAATADANTATTNAVAATEAAVTAKQNADAATAAATEATAAATEATGLANTAAAGATTAKQNADVATEAATNATTSVLAAYAKLIPSGLTVSCLKRITLGNLAEKFIKAVLAPEGTMHNMLFISDNKAVSVAPDGRISVQGKGISTVHIIPTCNTALAKSVVIEVGDPTLRLVNTRNCLRFTSSGSLRFN